MCDGERQAAVDAAPVKQDCAGAALTTVTAFLRTGQPEPVTKRVEQRSAGVDGQVVLGPIDP
jgi:hypothetical protein